MGAVTITMSPRHFVFILISMFSSPVSCYPGALCNVTYDIPLPCDQVFSALAAQMREWDETSECPGQCEQRLYSMYTVQYVCTELVSRSVRAETLPDGQERAAPHTSHTRGKR